MNMYVFDGVYDTKILKKQINDVNKEELLNFFKDNVISKINNPFEIYLFKKDKILSFKDKDNNIKDGCRWRYLLKNSRDYYFNIFKKEKINNIIEKDIDLLGISLFLYYLDTYNKRGNNDIVDGICIEFDNKKKYFLSLWLSGVNEEKYYEEGKIFKSLLQNSKNLIYGKKYNQELLKTFY